MLASAGLRLQNTCRIALFLNFLMQKNNVRRAWRAKPISCVTTTIVLPSSSASCCMMRSTSPTSSGSSAPMWVHRTVNVRFHRQRARNEKRAAVGRRRWTGYLP
ncbi:hypothetical protein KCP73_21105 [Salmonella enterica subsp. enterica]|nr:hypothetical protein KCP73_21105 [Salmonella enterica subsp. enterica]